MTNPELAAKLNSLADIAESPELAADYRAAAARILALDTAPEPTAAATYQRETIHKDAFTAAYVEAMFSTDGGTDGELKEKEVSDISWSLASTIIHDCAVFQAAHHREIDSAYASAGHDFWLTRNGHGAGFWDGCWAKEEGERMDATAKAFGELEIYIGDDGLIYA